MSESHPDAGTGRFKILRKLIRARLKLAAVSRCFGLQPMVGNPLKRRSDTLFILGSGGSINDLNDEQWREICAADSLGFNFWLIHDFVPDTFVFEPPKDPGDYACMLENLKNRTDDYREVAILIKDGERHRSSELNEFIAAIPQSLRRNLRLSWDFEIPGHDRTAFEREVRFFARRRVWQSSWMPVPRKRASIFFLLVLALRAGYGKIVLCGIDLNNTDYFYDSRRAEYEARGRAVPKPRPLAGSHKTNDPQFGEMTIALALQALDNEVLKPAGVQLYVAFRSSGLYPEIPAYFDR